MALAPNNAASAARQQDSAAGAPDVRRRERTGSFGVFVSRFRGEAQHDAAWRTGDRDTIVAAELERLTADDHLIWMHDRARPGTVHATIDHIAIGPGGITVIDSKNLSGSAKVRVSNAGGMFGPRMDTLTVNNRDHTALIATVEQQAESIRDLLALRGLPHIDVCAALCTSNGDGLPMFRQLRVRGVLIDDTKDVARLAARRGALNSETVAVAHAHIAAALPSH
jgi:hypothetical protein